MNADPEVLRGLLKKIVTAKEPDRRLDYEVFRAFAQNDAPNEWDPKVGHFYTASLEAAFDLASRVLPEHDWILGHTNGGLTIHCKFGPTEAFAETPAMAVIAAMMSEVLAQPDPCQEPGTGGERS